MEFIVVLFIAILISIINIIILVKLTNTNTDSYLAEFITLITLYSEFLYQMHDKNKPINEIKKEIYDIIINDINSKHIAKKLNINNNALEIIVAGIIDKTIRENYR